MIFNRQCTYTSCDFTGIACIFPDQALLTFALYMMDDDDDIVMESLREDFPCLDTIVSQC